MWSPICSGGVVECGCYDTRYLSHAVWPWLFLRALLFLSTVAWWRAGPVQWVDGP